VDYKKSINVRLSICERGGLRNISLCNYDINHDFRSMSRPPLRDEVGITPDLFMGQLSGNVAKFVGLNWAVGFIPEGGVAVEIGCDFGDGLERMRHSGAKSILGIDPYVSVEWDGWFNSPQDEMDARYRLTRNRFKNDERVAIVRITSDDLFEGLPSGFTADWWFIDGDHREEPCYRDICNCFKHTKAGGHVCIDDVDCRDWSAGINSAVDRFLAKHDGEVEVVWRASSPAVLRKVK